MSEHLKPNTSSSTPADVLRAGIDDGALCGAVFSIGDATTTDQIEALGQLEPAATAVPMRADTVFDLASLTKVVATLPVILMLAAASELHLDDPIQRYLPQHQATSSPTITVRHLLTHTSGLPQAPKYYLTLRDAQQMRAAVLTEPPVSVPGSMTVYSDIGFMLLGFIAEAITTTPLDVAARRLVFDPLGMSGTDFRPSIDPERIAPTEILDGQHAVRGVVHDRNAGLLDGIPGHAGLFAPIHDLITYLRVWVGLREPPWGQALHAAALTRQTPLAGPARGLGWLLPGPHEDTFMSQNWPITGAGHTGFTGTSIAFDPKTQIRTVLLTNAIRCGLNNPRTHALRQSFHRRSACQRFA